MKYEIKFLYLLCILNAQNFVEVKAKAIGKDISEEIYSCDYTRFETQLERLNLQMKIHHETQLDQQKLLFNKINELSLQIKGIERNLLEKHEAEPQVSLVTPPAVDKLLVMTEIRENLKQHDSVLAKILNNQNDMQERYEKFSLDNHTQTLQNTISDKLIVLEKIDAKITNIESNMIPKNVSIEIINNQNNIQNLLNELNLKDLKSTISENLALIPKIEEKLTNIGNNSIPKSDQLKFYEDIQQYLNVTETYHKNDSTSNYQSYPTYCSNNKRLIKNHLYGPEPFLVPCREDGGVWTVIQRRIDGSVDFYRNWAEYKTGFGNVEGEFFIGLDKLHALTSTLKPVELMIELQDFDNVMKYAKYDDFQIDNESQNYKLIRLGSYTGDAGDSFSLHVGYNFSTKDRDNDIGNGNCAIFKTGAWWHRNCGWSNLNGKYYHNPTKVSDVLVDKRGIYWDDFNDYYYSLKFVQMLIRPRKL